MKTYEKAIEDIKKLLPDLKMPCVNFFVAPLHGADWVSDDEPITLTATYSYGDSRDLCDWLTNPAKVEGVESYLSSVFLPPPYDTGKVAAFLANILSWHKSVSYTSDDKNVPEQVQKAWGGSRPGSGRKPVEEKRKPYPFRLTLKEHAKVKDFIQIIKEDNKMTQAQYYEAAGDSLKGVDATKAYRAAQNHLQSTDPDYMTDWKRLQDKIIKSLEAE